MIYVCRVRKYVVLMNFVIKCICVHC